MTHMIEQVRTFKQYQNESPCDRHSCLLENEICMGCKRTIDEIMEWNELSSEQKANIMQRLENVNGD